MKRQGSPIAGCSHKIPLLDLEDDERKTDIKDCEEIKSLRSFKTEDQKEYDVVKAIGEGVFGVVFHVTDKKQKKDYALKVIKEMSNFVNSGFRKEKRLLEEVEKEGHPNLLRLIWAGNLSVAPFRCTKMALLTELAGPSLHDLLNGFEKENDEGLSVCFPVDDIRIVGRQILSAMLKLLSLNIFHLDLKPENLYFMGAGHEVEKKEYKTTTICDDKEIELKEYALVIKKPDLRITIGDFGSARQHGPSDRVTPKQVQSQNYRAPEIFMGMAFSTKADVWSFGAVMCEMYTGELLFYGTFEGDTEMAQFELMKRVVGQQPTNTMFREAISVGSQHIALSPHGYRMKNIVIPPMTVPLLLNMRFGDAPARELFTMLEDTMIFDPSDRPTFQQVFESEFFAENADSAE
ncbi:unnamed protein product [Caenorhabditis sp. 36 PRJEB53466]|nr:unnamed protein product [Caenorhabditis sp. 36 PRJEB53466]